MRFVVPRNRPARQLNRFYGPGVTFREDAAGNGEEGGFLDGLIAALRRFWNWLVGLFNGGSETDGKKNDDGLDDPLTGTNTNTSHTGGGPKVGDTKTETVGNDGTMYIYRWNGSSWVAHGINYGSGFMPV